MNGQELEGIAAYFGRNAVRMEAIYTSKYSTDW